MLDGWGFPKDYRRHVSLPVADVRVVLRKAEYMSSYLTHARERIDGRLQSSWARGRPWRRRRGWRRCRRERGGISASANLRAGGAGFINRILCVGAGVMDGCLLELIGKCWSSS